MSRQRGIVVVIFIALLSLGAEGKRNVVASCKDWTVYKSDLKVTGTADVSSKTYAYETKLKMVISPFEGENLFTDIGIAHVHANACSDNNGGPHWKKDPTKNDSTTANEIHAQFSSEEKCGTFEGQGVSNFTIDTRAKSIVVHASNGAKLFCCDLEFTPGFIRKQEQLAGQVQTRSIQAQGQTDEEVQEGSSQAQGQMAQKLTEEGSPQTESQTAQDLSPEEDKAQSEPDQKVNHKRSRTHGREVAFCKDWTVYKTGLTVKGNVEISSKRNQTTMAINISPYDGNDLFTEIGISHVHANLCDDNNGGAHWKKDPTSNDSTTTNEIHANFLASDNSTFSGAGTSNFTIDTRAKSVVVHGANNEKLFCCNLEFNPRFVRKEEKDGKLDHFGHEKKSHEVAFCKDWTVYKTGLTVTGNVNISTKKSQTTMEISVSPFNGNDIYSEIGVSHVHANLCDDDNGGAHWRKDPSSNDSTTTNEIHAQVLAFDNSTFSGAGTSNFTIDTRAKSVVVHGTNKEKLFCCNLEFHPRFVRKEKHDGKLDQLRRKKKGHEVAFCKDWTVYKTGLTVTGNVEISTTKNQTTMEVSVSPLNGNDIFTEIGISHVHANLCDDDNGGAHWRKDPSSNDSTTANEIHAQVSASEIAGAFSGSGTSNFSIDTRAKSVVVHGTNKEKLFCCNLKFTDRFVHNEEQGGKRFIKRDHEVAFCKDWTVYKTGLAVTGNVDISVKKDRTTMEVNVSPYNGTNIYTEIGISHVHANLCDDDNGGAHWKKDPTSNDSTTTNEIHAQVSTSENSGSFSGSGTSNFTIDTRAKSVVIHGANSEKLFCCNLEFNPRFVRKEEREEKRDTRVKTVSVCKDWTVYKSDLSVKGYVDIAVKENQTIMRISVSPLNGTDLFTDVGVSHVHANLCNDENGGAHWKKDPTSEDSTTTNEIHAQISQKGQSGVYFGSGASNFTIDSRAKSVVVHGTNSEKLFCCNLEFVPGFN